MLPEGSTPLPFSHLIHQSNAPFLKKLDLITVRSGHYKTWESVLRHQLGALVATTFVIAFAFQSAKAQSGIASVYSTESGSHTASGQRLNPGALTAAHRTLPFGSRVRVTNRANGSSIVVTINDRGPFVRGRIIDITPAAARSIGMSSVAPVTVERE
jgi:rare lipoprotein A